MVMVKVKGRPSPQIIAKYLGICDFGGIMDLQCLCLESPTGHVRVGRKHSVRYASRGAAKMSRDLEQLLHTVPGSNHFR
jgi:hypothetical protein